MFSVEYI